MHTVHGRLGPKGDSSCQGGAAAAAAAAAAAVSGQYSRKHMYASCMLGCICLMENTEKCRI